MARPGLELLAGEEAGSLHGRRIALLCHAASVSTRLEHAVSVLKGAGAEIVRIFAPEHGVTGVEQDMAPVDETRDPMSGAPVVSLYGDTEDSLTPSHSQMEGVDLLVVDLMDVGSRYYTYAATAIRALPVAAERGVEVVVCDRPNPLGGIGVEGNLVEPRFTSFVSELSVPNRHGLSIGELARLAVRDRRIDVGLRVLPAEGWRRSEWWNETSMPWVLPSPNMPTLETAVVYPGTCLVEGTNLSEGRGTTRPFEIVGAPWIDPSRLADDLTALGLPGVSFRPLSFLPTFQKHAGATCFGVQLHVDDRHVFRPVVTGLALVALARVQDPEAFAWRTEEYEFVTDRLAFDLLAGCEGWRRAIEEGVDPRDVAAAWSDDLEAFEERASGIRLYES